MKALWRRLQCFSAARLHVEQLRKISRSSDSLRLDMQRHGEKTAVLGFQVHLFPLTVVCCIALAWAASRNLARAAVKGSGGRVEGFRVESP